MMRILREGRLVFIYLYIYDAKQVKRYLIIGMISAFMVSVQSQQAVLIRGNVTDSISGEALIGASIMDSEGSGTITDPRGEYSILVSGNRISLTFQYLGYSQKRRILNLSDKDSIWLNVRMSRSNTMLDEIVVSASKYEQRLSQVMVSLDIIKPDRISNTATMSLETLIRQTPGVEILEGQTSIRGGSGYSYGAGSRVLVLMDDLPLLSGDAGDVKWDYLPIENISQIEIIKGASSVLYGSSALNGIINIRSAYPLKDPKTRLNIYSGVYLDPSRDELIWWKSQPLYYGAELMHSRKIKNLDLVLGANVFRDEGYREDENRQRARFNMNLEYRDPNISGLSYGFRLNSMLTEKTDFLVWRNSRWGAYRQNPEAVSALSGNRFNIDPYLIFHGKNGAQHNLKTRLFHITNDFRESSDKNNRSDLFFGEYKFHQRFLERYDLSIGLSGTHTKTFAELYGDHTSFNQAAYAQFDARLASKLNLSAGMRFERYRLDQEVEYSSPVFRAGLNFQLTENSFLRASFGQGYRFPSVAEKFTATNVGSLNIFPNPDLRSEYGWSSEIGFKQGLKISEWYGYLDLAAFWTGYRDMIEFTFGIHDSIANPTIDDYGFKALNVGNSRIMGLELTLAGEGTFGPIPVFLAAGYTFMHPVDLEMADTLNSEGGNFLKYRYRHSAKTDAEMRYKRFTLGFTIIINSRMERIDEVFLDPLYGNLILPGFPDYWEEHNKGTFVLDARWSCQITYFLKAGLVMKNIFNREYMGRPGDIQPPRNVTLRFCFEF